MMRALRNCILVIGLTALLSCAISACSRSASTQAPVVEKPIILLLLKDYNNEFFRKIDEGFRAGMPEDLKKNYDLEVRYASSWTDLSYERRQLDHYLSDYVLGRKEPRLKAVVVTAGSSNDELTSQIKQLRDNHVIVVLADQRINPEALKRANTDYDAFIGTLNKAGGVLGADQMVKHLPNGGTILLLNGATGVRAAIDRRQGFLDRLAELSKQNGCKYKVIERTANFTRSEAQSTLDGLLSMGQQPDGIFAANDEMALGALEALRQKKSAHKSVVVGFDAIQEAVAAVKDGRLVATIAQDPMGIGKKSAITVDKLLKDEPIEKDQFLAPKAVSRE
jgi:ribose transport system substrate-binding protein